MINRHKYKMVKTKIEKQLILLKKLIIDEVINDIKELKLSNESDIIEKINKREVKRAPPKIAIEKQCSKKCKSGKKCTVPKCYKETCWAHLSTEDKKRYQKMKKAVEHEV